MVPIKVDALKTMRLKWGPWWPQPAWEENCLGLENPNSSLPCANQPAEGHLSFTCFRVFENNPNNHVGNVNKHRTMLVNVSFYRSYFKKVKKVIKKLLKKIKNCQRPQKATIKLQKKFSPILTEHQIWHLPHVLASAQWKMVTNWDSLTDIYSSNIVSDLSLQLYHWYWKVLPKKKNVHFW